ncbi:MAG: hypothetical protein QG597_4719 [Actinomycetota bacterium]|nr:hypothetical protein [Actinomycetota bacterium]
MRAAPTAWSEYQEARFRLAGFGGAAVYLRTCLVPGVRAGAEAPAMAVDIGFLSPETRRHVLARLVNGDLPARLSEFLISAAAEEHPELSVPALQDDLAGLVITVESSTDSRVCLNWSLVEDLEAEVRDFDGLNFETSRAALVSASQEAALLADGGLHYEPGVDY